MTPTAIPARTILLGLGNPILGDDGVGCSVAELVGSILGSRETLTVITASVSPVRLVDSITGYDRLIVVDSVTTGSRPVGTLMEMEFVREAPPPPSVHHLSVQQLPEIAEALGLPCPEVIRIYGIEIERPLVYTDRLSPDLDRLMPAIAEELIDLEFNDLMENHSKDTARGELAV